MQINVLEYFENTASRLSEKVAVVDRDTALTFGQLRSEAAAIAGLLQWAGEACNRPIAVFLPKSKDAVVTILAVLQSGNFYVPLDVKSPTPRLAAILQNLEPMRVIANKATQASLEKAGWPREKTILVDAPPSPAENRQPLPCRRPAIIDTDPAYIIYTSGSTGTPKGVVISHRGVMDYIDWARDCYAISESDVIGSQAPFYFDNSTLDLHLCFSCGATLNLIPEEAFAFPLRLMEYARTAGITTIFWVPSVMTNVANFKILDTPGLPPFQKILFAGEVMPTRTVNYWRRRPSSPSAMRACFTIRRGRKSPSSSRPRKNSLPALSASACPHGCRNTCCPPRFTSWKSCRTTRMEKSTDQRWQAVWLEAYYARSANGAGGVRCDFRSEGACERVVHEHLSRSGQD